MRTAARGIIIKDNNLLVMDRNKFGLKYYALVGGGVDRGETPEQALYREIAEETTVKIANHKLVIVEDAGEMYGIQYIYVCDYVSGEPKLDPASIEASITEQGQNTYRPVWLPLADLPQVNFLPGQIADAILSFIKNGFPEEPLSIKIDDSVVYNRTNQ